MLTDCWLKDKAHPYYKSRKTHVFLGYGSDTQLSRCLFFCFRSTGEKLSEIRKIGNGVVQRQFCIIAGKIGRIRVFWPACQPSQVFDSLAKFAPRSPVGTPASVLSK